MVGEVPPQQGRKSAWPRHRQSEPYYASQSQPNSYIYYPPLPTTYLPPQQPSAYPQHHAPFVTEQYLPYPTEFTTTYYPPPSRQGVTQYPNNNFMYIPKHEPQIVYYNQPSYQPVQQSPGTSVTPSNAANHSPVQLPRIIFQGDIIIVNTIDKVKPALEELFRDGTAMTHGIGFVIYFKLIVRKYGMETQFRERSTQESYFSYSVGYSIDKVCVIFWMMYLGHVMPLELFEVLASPDILKIGQSMDSGDNERLLQEFHLCLTNSVDISILARRKGFIKTNLKEQTKVLLGKNLSKYLCTSNWADIHLTPGQIRYAATDPYLMELPDAPPPPIAPPHDGEEDQGDEGNTSSDISVTFSGLAISSETSPDPQLDLSTKCPYCDRYFMKKVQLFAHLDHAHFELLPSGPQTCPSCYKPFRKYSALLIHQDMTGHVPL